MAEKTLAEVIDDHQAGKLDLAEAGYRNLLLENPDNADAIHLLGVIFFQKSNLDEARDHLVHAIALNRRVALYHANLGRIEKARGEITSAIAAYRQSLILTPEQADINSDMAAALVDAGDYAEALKYSEHALKLQPRFVAATFNRGMALVGLGDLKAAAHAFEQAVQLDDRYIDAWFQLARVYHNNGCLKEAEATYRKVISIAPGHCESLCNLGNILRASGHLSDALMCYDQALVLMPDLAEVHSNKGVALQELGRREEAIFCYRRAIDLDPDDAEAHRNLSMALLQGGEFKEGWKEFEWRWQTRHFAGLKRQWNKPQWAGEPLNGQTIVVHAEQGFGDSFQFCRYIPLLVERGARVILEAPHVVQGVLGTLNGIEELVTPGERLPAFDIHIPMMSLPGVFGTTSEIVPAPDDYLSVPPEAEQDWRGKIEIAEGVLRIGLVWKGRSEHGANLWRSPGLEVFRPLLTRDQFKFYSLQKNDGETDLRAAGMGDRIVDLHNDLNSFSDTAAVINQLDLVITPDTSVAHLSGALGCPTWIVLPHVAEWRWGVGREDCPWYPSARLFRQPSPGDWDGVIEHLASELDRIRA